MKKWMIAALLAGGLWACNNEAGPNDRDTDQTRVEDSGSTPGANTAVNDTLTMESGAAIDSAALDTGNTNNNR
jgi:hypothetical protein